MLSGNLLEKRKENNQYKDRKEMIYRNVYSITGFIIGIGKKVNYFGVASLIHDRYAIGVFLDIPTY